MVTNPNWIAPFHIARAMLILHRIADTPPGYPDRGVGTVTIAHPGKGAPCTTLFQDDERI